VNREEAKEILLPYRHGSSDAGDPQIAEALSLAKSDPELAGWLEDHSARQDVLQKKFRSIAVPTGLKEQIISEHAAAGRTIFIKKNRKLAVLVAVMIVLLGTFYFWQPQPREDAGLVEYQKEMTSVVAWGYGMDLATNDIAGIRNFLRGKNAPANFDLTGPLGHTPLAGCSIEKWQDQKVSLICFHAGVSGNAAASDLWLFVVDRKLVANAPSDPAPKFSQVNKLAIATWTAGNKLYLLSRQGKAEDLKKFLQNASPISLRTLPEPLSPRERL
jgi:uncharacterized membrane protein YbaN (DUF454 family)